MANNPKELPNWKGRVIAKLEDVSDLESRSAINEFKHKMPRADAEEAAYKAHKDAKHKEAAAHHLRGIKAAQGAGDHQEAQKHSLLYSQHMEKLGLNPLDAVPDEIKGLGEKQERFYKFRPHRNDAFVLQTDKEPQSKT